MLEHVIEHLLRMYLHLHRLITIGCLTLVQIWQKFYLTIVMFFYNSVIVTSQGVCSIFFTLEPLPLKTILEALGLPIDKGESEHYLLAVGHTPIFVRLVFYHVLLQVVGGLMPSMFILQNKLFMEIS